MRVNWLSSRLGEERHFGARFERHQRRCVLTLLAFRTHLLLLQAHGQGLWALFHDCLWLLAVRQAVRKPAVLGAALDWPAKLCPLYRDCLACPRRHRARVSHAWSSSQKNSGSRALQRPMLGPEPCSIFGICNRSGLAAHCFHPAFPKHRPATSCAYNRAAGVSSRAASSPAGVATAPP